MKEQDDYHLEKLKNSKQMACDGWVYSIQRMDLLIISISGAGVYIILETLKYSLDHTLNCTLTLKIAGIFFVLSIIINFISQWTGQNANFHHISWIDETILAGKAPTEEQQSKITECDCSASIWHSRTKFFNGASMILMFIGLISFICYFTFMI